MCIQGFGGGNLKERDQLEYLGVDGFYKEDLQEVLWEGRDRIDLAQDRVGW